jgi:hypothetical protein
MVYERNRKNSGPSEEEILMINDKFTFEKLVNIETMLDMLEYYASRDDISYLNGANNFYYTWCNYAPRICNFIVENMDIIRYDRASWIAIRQVFGDEMSKAQRNYDKEIKLAEIKEAATGYDC